MNAEEIMRPADADIHVDHNLCEAQARFAGSARDRLLVIDGDEVVGTLHRDDLPADRDSWDRLTVQEVMTATGLPTCAPDDSQSRVRALLDKYRFVLVLDGEREIVGIIEGDPAQILDRSGQAAAGGTLTGAATAGADTTGGRTTLDGEDRLHVYSSKPHVRRLREPR